MYGFPGPRAASVTPTSHSTSDRTQALAERSRIMLAAADGLNTTEIAKRLGITVSTARRWRNRFAEHRLDGLTDEPRPGQPRRITDAQVEEVIVKTLETTP